VTHRIAPHAGKKSSHQSCVVKRPLSEHLPDQSAVGVSSVKKSGAVAGIGEIPREKSSTWSEPVTECSQLRPLKGWRDGSPWPKHHAIR
jgi:hypothetical protein